MSFVQIETEIIFVLRRQTQNLNCSLWVTFVCIEMNERMYEQAN